VLLYLTTLQEAVDLDIFAVKLPNRQIEIGGRDCDTTMR
jgi:hypothetical protein